MGRAYRYWSYAELRRLHARWVGPSGTGRDGETIRQLAAAVGVHPRALNAAMRRHGFAYPPRSVRLEPNRFDDKVLVHLCQQMHAARVHEGLTWREVAERFDIRARSGAHEGEVSWRTAQDLVRGWRQWVAARSEAEGEPLIIPSVGDTKRSRAKRAAARQRLCVLDPDPQPGRCRQLGCDRAPLHRGLCPACYARARRHGQMARMAGSDGRRERAS